MFRLYYISHWRIDCPIRALMHSRIHCLLHRTPCSKLVFFRRNVSNSAFETCGGKTKFITCRSKQLRRERNIYIPKLYLPSTLSRKIVLANAKKLHKPYENAQMRKRPTERRLVWSTRCDCERFSDQWGKHVSRHPACYCACFFTEAPSIAIETDKPTALRMCNNPDGVSTPCRGARVNGKSNPRRSACVTSLMVYPHMPRH